MKNHGGAIMAQEKYPLPSMKLKDIIKLAHSKVVKSGMSSSEKASLNTLLKSATFKVLKKEHAEEQKMKEVRKEKLEKQSFSDPETAQLMKEAMLDLEKKDIEMQKMTSKIMVLERDSKELKALQQKMREDRIQEIVKRENKLGIVSKEEFDDRVEIYRKLHSEDLDKIEKSLKDKKPLAVSQKMSEVGTTADAGLETRRKLFKELGINIDPSEIEGDIKVMD